MAIVILGQAVEHGPGDAQAKLVLVALCNYANADGVCWPSIETLVRISSCHRATVFRKLKLLEKEGWIERVARTTKRGATAVSHYQINAQKLLEAHAEYLAAVAQCDAGEGGGSHTATGGSLEATLRGSHTATQTLKKQELEPSQARTPARPAGDNASRAAVGLEIEASLQLPTVREGLILLRRTTVSDEDKDAAAKWLVKDHPALMERDEPLWFRKGGKTWL